MASGGFRTQPKSFACRVWPSLAESPDHLLDSLTLPFHAKEERHLPHYLLLDLWLERKSQH